MPSKFIMQGAKMATTYEDTSAALPHLMNDFYEQSFKMAKSAGAATYGDNGYFNAIMGKEITAGMFASDNLFTALGARAYNHEGQRVATELASFVDGKFKFAGADTEQDGDIPDGISMPVDEIREPYKELPFPFDYGMGLMTLENKDDTIAYKDYIDMMGKQYTDNLDKSIARPITIKQTKKNGRDTGLENLARVNSSYTEAKAAYDAGKDIDCCPYGGVAYSDLEKFRNHKVSNYDAQFIDNAGEAMTDDSKFRRLYRDCSVNWADSANPNNKFWAMSHIAQEKLAATLAVKNFFLDSVYVQRDFNGVKTMPGRDGGMLLASFENAPIIQDGNLAYDYDNGKVSSTDFGEVHLVDGDHAWVSVLTPVELFTANNVAYTRALREKNVMMMRAELRSDRWIGSGRLVGGAE